MMRARVAPIGGTTVLAVTLCALLAALWHQLGQEGRIPATEAGVTAALVETAPSVETIQVVRRPDVFYAAIIQRPLFAPDRRPDIEPVPEVARDETAVAPEPAATDTDFRLLGVFGRDKTRRALVQGSGGEDPDWAGISDSLPGNWKIKNIGDDWVEISRGAATQRLELYR